MLLYLSLLLLIFKTPFAISVIVIVIVIIRKVPLVISVLWPMPHKPLVLASHCCTVPFKEIKHEKNKRNVVYNRGKRHWTQGKKSLKQHVKLECKQHSYSIMLLW